MIFCCYSGVMVMTVINQTEKIIKCIREVVIKNRSNKIINIMVKMIEINKRQKERKKEISI